MARALIDRIRRCTVCTDLPLGPRPILQLDPTARILIAGQAPGRRAHERRQAFDDPSGDRLRGWMGIERDTFYDSARIAILPMGFCYPGTGSGGDLPPRPVCADTWRDAALASLTKVRLTIVIGLYAQRWHLNAGRSATVTDIVRGWRSYWPDIVPLPHPSPRNARWLKANPFVEAELVPALQARVASLIG